MLRSAHLKAAALGVALTTLSACAGHQPDPEQDIPQGLSPCHDPRPEMCTMDYKPVCGQLENGQFRTYANACSACADAKVVGSRKGECKESQ